MSARISEKRRAAINSRASILDAAQRAALREGSAHLTIDAVARESGLSKGGVLYHFPAKEALLEAMVERLVAVLKQIVEERRRVHQRRRCPTLHALLGASATRFMLTYAPNEPNAAYAELIVRVQERGQIPELAERLRRDLAVAYPQADIRTERVVFGPPVPALIEARFAGPDPRVLRQLGEEALTRMATSGAVRDLRQDWRQRELVVKPAFDRDRARTVGVDRVALASALRYSSVGTHAATYREHDRLVPILIRASPSRPC